MNYNLRADLQTLLNRALKGKEVVIFGEDGNGRFARFAFPVTAAICSLCILDDSTDERAYVGLMIHVGNRLIVDDKDIIETHGRPDGDQNLKLSINALLRDASIDTGCWKFTYRTSPYNLVLEIDVKDAITK